MPTARSTMLPNTSPSACAGIADGLMSTRAIWPTAPRPEAARQYVLRAEEENRSGAR